MSSLTESYSGIILNQNVPPTGSLDWQGAYGGDWVYQTFYLPDNYARGVSSAEQRYPDLSGFQIMVLVSDTFAPSASLDYTIDYYIIGSGWANLAQGTQIGAHSDSQIWMDVIFPESVTVNAVIASSMMRIGVATRTATGLARNIPTPSGVGSPGVYVISGTPYTADLVENVPFPISIAGVPAFLYLNQGDVTYSYQQGITDLYYVSPNPLTRRDPISSELPVGVQQLSEQGQALQADSFTPLLTESSSINFRILALSADSGTDFLGNEYRSVAIQADGTDTSWMSPPQPSQFAVVSRYFDVRPIPENPALGTLNIIGNPSFEYDAPGQSPGWWGHTNYPTNDHTVRNNLLPGADPAFAPAWNGTGGVQSLHLLRNFPSSSMFQFAGVDSPLIPVQSSNLGQPTTLALSCNYDLVATIANMDLVFIVVAYDNTSPTPLQLSTTTIGLISTLGVGEMSGVVTIPANAAQISITLGFLSLTNTAGTIEAYFDNIQGTFTPAVIPYFDGDTPGDAWIGQKGQSMSAQLIEPSPLDDESVLDGVLVDPLLPNTSFNVYYSSDDVHQSDHMTEADWEDKLWRRIPQVYVAIQKQQYAFPTPIKAKYMKVEFTNLQAKSYNPGNFQMPTAYKKFPTWVLDYFLVQLEQPSFAANFVNVQTNALQLAYDYYLDDLGQEPNAPTAAPTNIIPTLTSYFSPTAINQVDAATARDINLVLAQYTTPVGSIVDTSTLIGQMSANLVGGGLAQQLGTSIPITTQVEGSSIPPLDYSAVSSLMREPVIFEQSMPVMFFFVTCRHAYKELTASFEFNRAYFAGVKDITFLRNNYSTEDDATQYIESGADTFNTSVTDFVLDDNGNWYTYG